MDADLKTIAKHVRNEKRVLGVIGLLAVVVGVGLIAAGIAGGTFHGWGNFVGAQVFAVGLFLGPGLLAIRSAWRNPAKSPVVRALVQEPDSVCWLYVQYVSRSGARAAPRIHVACVDGSNYSVYVSVGEEKLLLAALKRRCPGATVGYSSQREGAFNREPAPIERSGCYALTVRPPTEITESQAPL